MTAKVARTRGRDYCSESNCDGKDSRAPKSAGCWQIMYEHLYFKVSLSTQPNKKGSALFKYKYTSIACNGCRITCRLYSYVMLCHIILYYIISYHIISYHIINISHYIILIYYILYHIILYYIILYYITLHYITLHYIILY